MFWLAHLLCCCHQLWYSVVRHALPSPVVYKKKRNSAEKLRADRHGARGSGTFRRGSFKITMAAATTWLRVPLMAVNGHCIKPQYEIAVGTTGNMLYLETNMLVFSPPIVRIYKIIVSSSLHHLSKTIWGNVFLCSPRIFFFSFMLRRMGKKKALAHHTSTYIHVRVVCQFNSVAFAAQRWLAHPSDPIVV